MKQQGFIVLIVACRVFGWVGAAKALADVPPPPDFLYYDMDFNDNGQKDEGDLAKLCEWYMDFRQRGELTETTNRANMYHDDRLDHRDIELLIDEWLNPKKHPFMSPPDWPLSSSQAGPVNSAFRHSLFTFHTDLPRIPAVPYAARNGVLGLLATRQSR